MYNYVEEMKKNINDWILENGMLTQARLEQWSREELYDWLYDELWDKDCITGNYAYGYASEEECSRYVGDNLGLYFEAAREFDDYPTRERDWTKSNPAKHMDTTIRCYLLGECLYQALNDLGVEDK